MPRRGAGERVFRESLQSRFPDLEGPEADLLAAALLREIAEKMEAGWTLGLAKVGKDGLPTQLRLLEMKGADDPSKNILEDLFVSPITIKTPKRKR